MLGHFNKQRTEPTQADKAKSLMAKSWVGNAECIGITTKIEDEEEDEDEEEGKFTVSPPARSTKRFRVLE